MTVSSNRRGRRIALHLARAGLLAAILALIHWQQVRRDARREHPSAAPIALPDVARIFPEAASLAHRRAEERGPDVLDASGRRLGYVLQTSPDSNHIIGFSGPTNVLIAVDADDRIAGLRILSSGDTREHVEQVRRDADFLESFRGARPGDPRAIASVDAVSGATLTSLAVQESVLHRLRGKESTGNAAASLRFPEPLTLEQARELFPDAASIARDPVHVALWHARDANDTPLGSILRTSPAADNLVGYQGPTESRIAFGPRGRVQAVSIGASYDNEPYVGYVRDDAYFLGLFNDLLLEELAELDPEEAEIEGVSGATMTSLAVTEGLILAAREHRQALAAAAEPSKPARSGWTWKWRDAGTALVIACGLVVGLTSLRGNNKVRIAFQLLLIGYLGLINGDMISQAMLVGWARHGIPWRHAGGLVLLTAAALILPLTTRRNLYCTHLCPHGAAQQLLKLRGGWQPRLPDRLSRALQLIPAVLLGWCVVVGILALPFRLVDIEPFDAWVFRIAGPATIAIAVVGLVASLFVPMAYCRFGCPTGALLNFLRFHSRGHDWTARDWIATGLLLLAIGLALVS